MPRERFTIRALGVAALIVAALGLGVFLGAPEVAVAQEDTTTTVVEDDSPAIVDESADESGDSDDKTRDDHDCGDRSAGSSLEGTSQSDA